MVSGETKTNFEKYSEHLKALNTLLDILLEKTNDHSQEMNVSTVEIINDKVFEIINLKTRLLKKISVSFKMFSMLEDENRRLTAIKARRFRLPNVASLHDEDSLRCYTMQFEVSAFTFYPPLNQSTSGRRVYIFSKNAKFGPGQDNAS